MDTVPKPVLNITISFEIEVEYDSFSGKTTEEVAVQLQDDIHETILDINPNILGVFSSILSVEGV